MTFSWISLGTWLLGFVLKLLADALSTAVANARAEAATERMRNANAQHYDRDAVAERLRDNKL